MFHFILELSHNIQVLTIEFPIVHTTNTRFIPVMYDKCSMHPYIGLHMFVTSKQKELMLFIVSHLFHKEQIVRLVHGITNYLTIAWRKL